MMVKMTCKLTSRLQTLEHFVCSTIECLRGRVFFSDSDSFLLNDSQDFLGQAFCTLGEIFGSLGCRLEKPLR